MRAAEHERIGSGIADGGEVTLEYRIRHGILEEPLLNERDQERTSHAGHADAGARRVQSLGVGAAADRRFRADHGDAATMRRGQSGFDAGCNDSFDGNVQ